MITADDYVINTRVFGVILQTQIKIGGLNRVSYSLWLLSIKYFIHSILKKKKISERQTTRNSSKSRSKFKVKVS